jgi:hypothetical protein
MKIEDSISVISIDNPASTIKKLINLRIEIQPATPTKYATQI